MSLTKWNQYLKHVELCRERIQSFFQYPYCLSAIKDLSKIEFHPKVTYIVGENGTGKSTILEAIAIACGFNPEAALSPSRQMSMLVIMNELIKKNSQFIIATHSPIIMSYPDSIIYELNDGIKEVMYKDTENYKITRNFLDKPEKMLKILLYEE
ncbi:AAA family ATPase [Clostridium sporogenes]|uniref:Rad50/SbcC-type AAA domain-containing protein n=1 Tax=Clostridium botulinum TaxID=1491 RepID=A0A6M0SZR5_CLOBO|nr:AAA family ATPase [Clostridium sporogenes]NFA61008.1 hypothetical protein [Clostridium botulinum]NFI73603.1 hypothetical protein [Clostridium sporogenes]NFL72941.1 hypothetical protein [Clostridium sporogenes]NFM25143.1 hypothetical protein [Clostridium sporogenes]NFP61149.1 hypothetical protein [Clostridium sporogenes]